MKKEANTGPAPMDPSAREGDSPTIYKPNERNCYALDQLVSEVGALFPEATFEVSNRNQRGVAFDVQFDLSGLDSDIRDDAVILFALLGDGAHSADARIMDIATDTIEHSALVSFYPNVHTMDDRSPFGLADAWIVLNGDDQ